MTTANVVPAIAFAGSSSPGNLGPFSLIKGGTPIASADSTIHVLRYSTVTDGAPSILVEDTDFTRSTNAITLTAPQTGLLTTERLFVYREGTIEQLLDLTSGGNYSGEALEARFDRLTEFVEEIARKADTAIRFTPFSTDALPNNFPMEAAIDKIVYLTGTAASPSFATIDNPDLLLTNTSALLPYVEAIEDVAADLTGADTIGTVAADLAGDDTLGTVAPQITNGNFALVAGTVDDGTFPTIAAGLAAKLDIATANRTITVGASGADYTTLQAAIDAVDAVSGYGQYTVTISILAGRYEMSTQALLRSSSALPIYITGATPVELTSDFVGVTSVTSNGDQDHDVVLEITGHGLSAGDCVLIRNTTGTGAHQSHHGFYEIDSVTTDTITYNHKGVGATWAANTVATMELYHLPTVLVATGTDILSPYHQNRSDDPGLLEGLSGTWRISNIGLLDESTDADATGVVSAYYGCFMQLYNFVGINGFKRCVRAVGPAPGIDCRNVFVHGASVTGFESQNDAFILATKCSATGCTSFGFRGNDGGAIGLSSSSVGAMNAYNFGASSGGRVGCPTVISRDAGTYDFWANDGGEFIMDDTTGTGTTVIDAGSRLYLDGTCSFDTLQLLGGSHLTGESAASINTKTYTNGWVDGVQYGGTVAFVAEGLASTSIASGSYVKVSPSEIADIGGVYASGTFTAPRQGVYRFDATGTFDAGEATAADAFAIIGRLKVYDLSGTSTSYRNIFRVDIASTTKMSQYTGTGSKLIKLDTGDTVEFEFYQTSGNTQTAASDATDWGFSGSLVSAVA